MATSTPKLVLIVLAALLAVCALALGLSQAMKHERTTTATIERHIDRVVVHANAGHVRLMGTEANRVSVREDLRWLWRRPAVHIRAQGSTLEVSGSCPNTNALNRCKADLNLAIPFDADVTVVNDTGDVDVDRLAGHLNLNTDTGDVIGTELNPAGVRAKTGEGNVDLAFTTQPVSVDAASDAGDVHVSVPPGGEYRVDATTKAGDVAVEGVLRNDRAVRSISASAATGNVIVSGRAAHLPPATAPQS
jgi:DUF4097 and DUF4098 domain-containing protein YvlB